MSERTAEPPSPAVITLADGQEIAGQLIRRRGDSRLWIRTQGATTVLWRPVAAESIVAIKPLEAGTPPARMPAESKQTDAQQAHELLFGQAREGDRDSDR
ncbi:MAG: hypothetical protein AAGF31_01015 [Planctomycetota bacterium]